MCGSEFPLKSYFSFERDIERDMELNNSSNVCFKTSIGLYSFIS